MAGRKCLAHALAAWLLCTGVALGAAVLREDFEAGTGPAPTNWRFVQSRGECTGRWDTLDGSRGLRLHIAKDATARATWRYTPKLPLKGSTPYRITVRILIAETTPESKVYLIAYEDGVESPSHWHTTPFLRGTQDWTTYTVEFRSRPDTTWLSVQCKLWYGTGYAWFDDLAIEELPPDAVVAGIQGQREPPADDGSPLQLMWYPAQRRPDGTLHLLPAGLSPVAFFPFGDRKAVKEPHLVLETPAGIEVAGEVVAGRSPMPSPVRVEPIEAEREGRPRRRWRVPIPAEPLRKNMRGRKPFWTGYHFIYVEPKPGCPERFEWRWRLENAGELGPEHVIPARLVRREAGELEPVEHFPLYAQHTGALRYPTPEGRARLLDYLSYAAIRGGLSLTHYQPEYAPIDKELASAGFSTWAWRFDSYELGALGGPLCVYADPKRARRKLCPSAQAKRLPAWFESRLEYYRKRLASGLKTVIIDYEPPVFDVCFCPECRRGFVEFAGLNAEEVAAMTPAQVQALPDHAWGRFRAQQNGAIVKHHIAAIHQVDPEVRVGLCSWPCSEWSANRGGDIRQFEPEVGFHAPMIYRVGTDYERSVRSTCEMTQAPVIPFLLASDMAVKGVFPLPRDVRLNMLATALSGGRGAILWVGVESLDGEYMNALRQSLEEIRLLQPFIIGGRRATEIAVTPHADRVRTITVDGREIALPASDSRHAVRGWTWASSRGRLAGVINYDKAFRHQARIAGASGARALFGPKPKALGPDAVVTLGPYEAAVVVW